MRYGLGRGVGVRDGGVAGERNDEGFERVDMHAGGRQRRPWRAVGEALGVQGVRRVERRLAHGVHRRHAAEEHLGWREEREAGMLVLVVVPAEERAEPS